ncbi:Protein hob3 [Penicillium oxalicum]|uniref:Protein hob3 n=1 Tax=Penicillium oxalicum TaxID=69781 RepID=UPI0020B713B4|nr:Protein hob3 [Penicillium oxalicum]KAI2788284.1 Protein hob3 [Penicillium oxalicum]
MSWAGIVSPSPPKAHQNMVAIEPIPSTKVLTRSWTRRIQEKCQPRNNAGDDEDGLRAAQRKRSAIIKTIAVFELSHSQILIHDFGIPLGHVERTNDRDYEIEERRYRTMEAAATRLQKEAKGYLDSLRAMTASQMRIAETIDAFYGDAGTRDGVSRSYRQAVEDLDAETIKALDGPYRTTVLDPISRFCAYFPDVNECIKKRNHKLLDYDAMRAKVKRLVEKPDKDASKLPRTERETELAKQAYEQLNEQLFTESSRSSSISVSPTWIRYLDAETRDQYARGDLDNRVEEVLQEIRELSIAGTV